LQFIGIFTVIFGLKCEINDNIVTLSTCYYDVIDILSKGEKLPEKYCNHPLKGNYKGYYDCHVLKDLVLIYKNEKERLILILFDIESHSNLFKK